MKTEARFNDVDYGWGNFKKSNWCKVCDSWMDKERRKYNKKWTKIQEKRKADFVANGGVLEIPMVGCTAEFINDELVVTSEGHPASEGPWRG